MIYFTSDLHFGHNKEFLYGLRGFSSIEEHDEQIIKNWNQIIKPEDTIYILGDVMLGDNFEGIQKLASLNGHLKIIRGNHDTDTRWSIYGGGWIGDIKDVELLGYATIIKSGKWRFYLSHFPTKVGNYDDEQKHTKFYCLCGHVHTKDKWLDWHDKCYHVELDAHNCLPKSIDDIINEIENKNI